LDQEKSGNPAVLSFSFNFSDGGHIVAAVGQEHRLGRWWRNAEARNSIVVVELHPRKQSSVK
jgi:ribosomal RNA-processing protein 9